MVQRSRRPAPKRLGDKLLQIRTALGLSQTEMVKRLNYQESPLYAAQISNFEQGKREPPVMLILAYARAAGVPMEYLVDDELDLPAKLPYVPKHEEIKKTRSVRPPKAKAESSKVSKKGSKK